MASMSELKHIEALESLSNLKGFEKLVLPKFYCEAKGIDWFARHDTPSLKSLLEKESNNDTVAREKQLLDQTEQFKAMKKEFEDMMAKTR
jgi:hypothetical protein